MKWLLFILMLGTFACSGKVTINEDEIQTDIFYAEGSHRPFTGKCRIVFSGTRIVKEEFAYKHGILHGEATAWYKNGQLRRKGSYSNGRISGKWEFWDIHGNKTVEAHYENDALNGTYILLYSNGKIREKGQFADNRRTGQWFYYNENGQPVKAIAQ
jgi:antitoxin component YwqK of YwqJK toxin-antitoxin module